MLALQCLGKRLGHLDIEVCVVGSVTEKPITERDVLLIASGSGERPPVTSATGIRPRPRRQLLLALRN